MSDLLAGFAEMDFTPQPGLPLRGQQRRRLAERTRDPLMANAMALRSDDETVVLVSVDICFLSSDFVRDTQQRFKQRVGVPGHRLLIHATHSHVAPVAITYYWGEADPTFVEHLREAILSVAEQALARLTPAVPFSGSGYLEHLGWNRRAMYADGNSAMHGDASRPDFIGSEGPRDPILSVLFFRDKRNTIKGILLNFATHPNCVENEEYYSADLPGEIRRVLKQLLGAELGVVYLTGSAGNVSPRILEPFSPTQPWMGEEGLLRSGLYVAAETAKVMAAATEPIDPVPLRMEQASLSIPVRPYPRPGDCCYPSFWSEQSKEYYLGHEADWSRRMREQSPVEVRLNVLRLGDTVLCTNPAELFVEFGLRIREASAARVTLISELTDGYVGYVPTPLAFSRGGYETWPCQTSQLIPEAGDRIVESTRALLTQTFR